MEIQNDSIDIIQLEMYFESYLQSLEDVFKHKNTAVLTYNFFQDLNDKCLRYCKYFKFKRCKFEIQDSIMGTQNKSNQVNVSKQILLKNNSVEKKNADITEHIETTNQDTNIAKLCFVLLKILCQMSNLNHNILKMVSRTYFNSALLIFDQECLIKNMNTFLKISDSKQCFTVSWTFCSEDNNVFMSETSDQSSSKVKEFDVVTDGDNLHYKKIVNTHREMIEVKDMVCSKICLASGIKDLKLWHVDQFSELQLTCIEMLPLYCNNKYVRHILFAFETLRQCIDTIKEKNNSIVQLKHIETIYDVVLGNWENYIPSVLDNNLELFASFINVLKMSHFEIAKLDVFWSYLKSISCTLKSKYFMLGTCFSTNFYNEDVFKGNWFLDNMTYSLSRSYLVSAGTFCYKVLIKKVLTEEQWIEIFLEKVVHLLYDSNIYIRQNVCNYWLQITQKKYPNIAKLIYNRLTTLYKTVVQQCNAYKHFYINNRNNDDVQRYLHAIILAIKLEKPTSFNSEQYNYIKCGLKCSNELIRGDAFLCCQTFYGVKTNVEMKRNNEVQSCQNFQDVFEFLEENINCDDANLRQTLYKVFKNYVINTESHFHKCIVPLERYVTDAAEQYKLPEYMNMYLSQYDQLYCFFMKNLVDGCNYQRLITTVQLINIIFENTQSRLNENQRKKRIPTIDFLIQSNQWKFISSECRERLFLCLKDDNCDIRNVAKHLLQTYFTYKEEETSVFLVNLKSSLEMMYSNVFYIAESGAYSTAVLIHLFYKSYFHNYTLDLSSNTLIIRTKEEKNCNDNLNELNLQFNNSLSFNLQFDETSVGRFFFFSTYFLNQCRNQAACLQRDILEAVKNKNSLHGSLTTLMIILTDETSPEYSQLELDQIEELINLLNETVLFLLDILCMKSKTTNFAPSFGEMGEAMNCIINTDDVDEALIMSPAHQVLFNCIWINLKVCCTFASDIAVAYTGRLTRNLTLKCCNIITHLLHKCRHKGAIQQAGIALGNILTKCLYDDPYPYELLSLTLDTILDSAGGSVSRKSAGVSILIHKLVTSDHSLKHQIFTMALDKIIEVADSSVIPSVETLKVDLPQATAFHMLQFLVADSCLRVPMFSYLERITLLCFEKMNSQEWTLRNAALQVFGVLLPKLVGTKKQDSENQISNQAFEEFFFQLPRISSCLRSIFSSTDCNTSALVSALTLVSRLKITGKLISDSHVGSDFDLASFLTGVSQKMLLSNIYTIRFLSANCYVNFLHRNLNQHFKKMLFSCLDFLFGRDTLLQHFIENDISIYINDTARLKIVDENHLHGHLLTLENLKEKLALDNIELDENFTHAMLTLLNSNRHCVVDIKFSTLSLLYKIFRVDSEQLGILHFEISFNNFHKAKKYVREIGWKLYVQEVIQFFMYNSLFDRSRNMNFKYIVKLIENLACDKDILNTSLRYLLKLLRQHAKSIVVSTDLTHKNLERAKDLSFHAQYTIRDILVLISSGSAPCDVITLEHVCNIILELYYTFIDTDFIYKDHKFVTIYTLLLNNFCTEENIVYTCPLILPVMCIGHSLIPHIDHGIDLILQKIEAFVCHKDCNEDFRYFAAMSMSIIYLNNPQLDLKIQLDLFKLASYLLEDEVYEVRHEIIYFMRFVELRKKTSQDEELDQIKGRTENEIINAIDSKSGMKMILKNPSVYLLNLLKYCRYFEFKQGLDIFFDILNINEEDIAPNDEDFTNPFDHHIKNFFSENVILAEYTLQLVKKVNGALSIDIIERFKQFVDLINKKYVPNELNERGQRKLLYLNEILQMVS